MATTTGPKPALSYPEPDELGPRDARTPVVRDPAALRDALVHAFEAAALAARDAVAAIDQDSAAAAVHASRKALRRARAVLGLVGHALPKGERRAVRNALREARRALSAVRDHAVAPETIAQLALDDGDRATADRVLASAAGAIPANAEIKQLVAESAARAAAQAEALQAALPRHVDWDTVARGIRDTYGAARRARRAAKRSRSWFHTWRRRSKELVYQLEVIARHAGPRIAAIHDELSGAISALGPVVDLSMVRDFVAAHGHGIAPEALGHLRGAIELQLDERMRSARKAARDAFRARPRKLEKRITKAMRRDLAPSDEDRRALEPHG